MCPIDGNSNTILREIKEYKNPRCNISVKIGNNYCFPCRYIERPLLINERKFHLRAYVLCIGSLDVYVYSEVSIFNAGLATVLCMSATLCCMVHHTTIPLESH